MNKENLIKKARLLVPIDKYLFINMILQWPDENHPYCFRVCDNSLYLIKDNEVTFIRDERMLNRVFCKLTNKDVTPDLLWTIDKLKTYDKEMPTVHNIINEENYNKEIESYIKYNSKWEEIMTVFAYVYVSHAQELKRFFYCEGKKDNGKTHYFDFIINAMIYDTHYLTDTQWLSGYFNVKLIYLDETDTEGYIGGDIIKVIKILTGGAKYITRNKKMGSNSQVENRSKLIIVGNGIGSISRSDIDCILDQRLIPIIFKTDMRKWWQGTKWPVIKTQNDKDTVYSIAMDCWERHQHKLDWIKDDPDSKQWIKDKTLESDPFIAWWENEGHLITTPPPGDESIYSYYFLRWHNLHRKGCTPLGQVSFQKSYNKKLAEQDDNIKEFFNYEK